MSAGHEETTLEQLLSGVHTAACGTILGGFSSLHRTEIYTDLLFDRLRRKFDMVEGLRTEADENWNQTFYLLYFRTLGDDKNKETFLELARRVLYKAILRERKALHAVEAMLLGASGLLELYPHDSYILDLKRDFEHYAAKYDICPMQTAQWELTKIRPANHPVLRIAQAAAFFMQNEFVLDRAMECRTEDDIRRLFRVEASEYWRTHHLPAIKSGDIPKWLGDFKAHIIAINLVAVLQYNYGSHTASETLRDRALTLLERLPAEHNQIVEGWKIAGVIPRNAFESQALLQLYKEYCLRKRCEECPLGVRLLKMSAEECQIANNDYLCKI